MGRLVIENPRSIKGILKFFRWYIRDALETWKRDAKAWKHFWNDYEAYNRIAPSGQQLDRKYLYPCLHDDTGETTIEPIYYYQDAWAFEKITERKPPFHVDIGSHHKYVALLSKVVPVTMVDIRPPSLKLDSLEFKKGSILDLPFDDRSIPSVSSLCVVEHIGLGRYGDPLDPLGSEKAIAELKRIIEPGGDIYISIPLDEENRTYFNAHRAFSEEYLMRVFKPFEISELRYIYGKEFGIKKGSSLGVGCYHLKFPDNGLSNETRRNKWA